MEPLLLILVPGIFGGLILAMLMASKRINLRNDGVARSLDPPSPSLINMAHIRVQGGGGLGIVAAVIVVALVDPRLRVLTAISALLGVGLAAVLIARRRRTGPLDSSGDDKGTHSMLGLGREAGPVRPPVFSDRHPAPLPPRRGGDPELRLAV